MPLAYAVPLTPFQAALVARLRAGVSGASVYDAGSVPLNPTFPYLTVQVLEARPVETTTAVHYDVSAAVQAVDRSAVGRGDPSAVNALAAQAVNAMNAALSVAGYACLTLRVASVAPLSEVDAAAGFVYRRVTVRPTYKLTPTS